MYKYRYYFPKKLADPLANKLTVKFMDGLQSLAAWRRCMLAD